MRCDFLHLHLSVLSISSEPLCWIFYSGTSETSWLLAYRTRQPVYSAGLAALGWISLEHVGCRQPNPSIPPGRPFHTRIHPPSPSALGANLG